MSKISTEIINSEIFLRNRGDTLEALCDLVFDNFEYDLDVSNGPHIDAILMLLDNSSNKEAIGKIRNAIK